MQLVSWVLQCLIILLSVAFFTLFERKVMGLFHNRLGPNKTSFVGFLQPLLDAFKLLTKQTMSPLRSNFLLYNMSPHFSLVLALFIWLTVPLSYSLVLLSYSFVMYYFLSSVMVFFVLFAGWSSNSKYSLIGSLRSIAQSISYESVLSTLIVMFSMIIFSFSISSFIPISSYIFFLFFPVWFICILAETHRAPFDFSESESELVSGFNTEYSGTYFAFLFLSEYSMLLFNCFLMTYIYFFVFFSSSFMSSLSLIIFVLILSYFFIWVRITFCRFRYDLLMMFAWKTLLPFVLLMFLAFEFLLYL